MQCNRQALTKKNVPCSDLIFLLTKDSFIQFSYRLDTSSRTAFSGQVFGRRSAHPGVGIGKLCGHFGDMAGMEQPLLRGGDRDGPSACGQESRVRQGARPENVLPLPCARQVAGLAVTYEYEAAAAFAENKGFPSPFGARGTACFYAPCSNF